MMVENLRKLGSASIVLVVIVLVIAFGILSFTSQFYYFLEQVAEQEVAIQLRSGKIANIDGPGVYSDFGLFVELQRMSVQAIPFSVRDDEIITKDKQRIGLVVSGDIFRPGVAQKDRLQVLWPKYRSLYLNDTLMQTRVQDLARQSMKVCIGERRFDDAIIGSARDDLRACIDDQLSSLAVEFGLEVENVVVPEVILSPEVQTALDAIVQSRLETEKAAQDKLRAEAQAEAEQARQEGEIRIEQSRIQEQAKQETVLAQLEQEKILSQKAVIEAERANELARVEAEQAIIEAQKNNELLAAERDLAINEAKAQAAIQRARAELANELTLAELYAANPEYVELQMMRLNASALNSTDKVIFTQEGTVPNLILSGPGVLPTINAQQPAPVQPTVAQDQ